MKENANINELDLHWTEEDPEFGIASEGVYCNNLNEIIEHISKVKDTVKKINLDNQQSLTEIPAVLNECIHLEELNISHTNITEIPNFLFALPALRSLSCCCSKLSSFPRGISKAEKLEFLHIRINKNWVLNDEITLLKNLKTLFIDQYSNAPLPQKLGTLTNLEKLSIFIKHDEGNVPLLPESFINHPSLKKLIINDPFYKQRKTFDLEHAAKILSSCVKLESLRLSGFSTGKGCECLSLLTGLKELNLRHLLTEGNIFNYITSLHNLEKLEILGSDFKITELPDIFENLRELRSFSFAGNFVINLPPSIYNLEKLSTLEIGSAGITELNEKISNLNNLESIQIYDNMLEFLPDTIFSLPRLTILNIEENMFKKEEINNIRNKINAKNKSGKKIELMDERQGHRKMEKKLRTLKNINTMDTITYFKHCLDAVNENTNLMKYINKEKLKGTRYYAELCLAAVKKTCFALKNIDCLAISKSHYFFICMEAARSPDFGHNFKLVDETLLSDDEYIQICVEGALHNHHQDYLNNINNDTFLKRFDRKTYENICWVAVLRYPPTITKMIEPTEELLQIAKKRCHK
ncbi:MAG: hypothetical protein FWD24_06495 [Treponema sp.]|nr:hypothetical protein [Treponema sp.]